MDASKKDRMAPRYMWAIGPLVFAFTTVYFTRIFSYLSVEFNFEDLGYSATIFMLMLVLFLLFINYLLALSRMMTADRRAWASLMRQSFLYLILTSLDIIKINMMNGDVFGIGQIPMLLCMIMMISVLLSAPVRRYYTPMYSEELSLKHWIPLILWYDPFRCDRVKLI